MNASRLGLVLVAMLCGCGGAVASPQPGGGQETAAETEDAMAEAADSGELARDSGAACVGETLTPSSQCEPAAFTDGTKIVAPDCRPNAYQCSLDDAGLLMQPTFAGDAAALCGPCTRGAPTGAGLGYVCCSLQACVQAFGTSCELPGDLAERIARTLGDDALADDLMALRKRLDDAIRQRVVAHRVAAAAGGGQ